MLQYCIIVETKEGEGVSELLVRGFAYRHNWAAMEC